MKNFAKLFDELDSTTSINEKVTALKKYFSMANPEDAMWAILILTGRTTKKSVTSRDLRVFFIQVTNYPEWLFEESYSQVGDTAEMISLLLQSLDLTRSSTDSARSDKSLTEWIEVEIPGLAKKDKNTERAEAVMKIWQSLDPLEVFLGDLIHNKKSWSEDIQKNLNDFFCRHAEVRWHLLLGNHEKGSKPFLDKLPINLIEGDFPAEPFLFSHGHDSGYKKESHFVIQGHIHPVIRLHHGAIRLRLRCFTLDRDRLTMPSFGSLTGGFEISRARGRRIFATTLDTVFEIPNSETNRRGVDK